MLTRICFFLAAVASAVQSCPLGCTCTDSTIGPEVRCKNQGFTTLPAGIPDDVALLELSGNDFKNFDKTEYAEFTQLKVLSLSSNNIRLAKSEGSLPGSLETLIINDNALESLDNIFSGSLANLETVEATNNALTDLYFADSTILPKLSTLNLAGNNIAAVQTFNHTDFGNTNILSLDLSNNVVLSLSSSLTDFTKFPSLQEINLSGNSLSLVDEDIFTGMENLHTVNLENTGFTHFSGFNGPALQRISVTGSTLESIDLDNVIDLVLPTTSEGLSLVFGGPSLESISVERTQHALHVISFGITESSDEGAFDIGSIVSRFPNCKTLSVANTGIATLTYGAAFYDALETVEFINSDVSKFIQLSSTELPTKASVLSIQSSGLKFLPAQFIDGFENLVSLSLSGNMLSHPVTLKNEKLRFLDLQGNLNLPSVNFDYLADGQLERVNLKGCGLVEMESIPSSVVYLDASENQIERIQGDKLIADDTSKLQHLDLSNNPLRCDCESLAHQMWLADELENGNLNPTLYTSLDHPCTNADADSISQFEIVTHSGSSHMMRCKEQGLTAIPSLIPDEITVLDLTDNMISVLDITTIEHLSALVDLYLSNNLISSVSTEGVLPASLRRLHLDQNQLSDVGTMFSTETAIYELRLNMNKLTNMNFVAALGMDNLETLDVADNEIGERNGTVASTTLYWLSLARNKIWYLDPRFSDFSALPALQFLDLSGNAALDVLDPQLFSMNHALISLNLDDTGINAFYGLNMTALETLQIRSPVFEHFDFDAFIGFLASNPVERFSLAIGGPHFFSIQLRSYTNLVYLKELTIDGGPEMDLTAILNRFPNAKTVRIVNTKSVNTAPVFSFPFYNTLEYLQFESADVSNFLELEKAMLPTGAKHLVMKNCGVEELSRLFLEAFENVEILDISENNIKTLPAARMPNLHWLSANGNAGLKNFEVMAPGIHTILANDCKLTTVPTAEGRPTVIEAKSNAIQHVDAAVMPDSIRWLELDGNSFICGCEDTEHQEWLLQYGAELAASSPQVYDSYNYDCANGVDKIIDYDLSYCDATVAPTDGPTDGPTDPPTDKPTDKPTDAPTTVAPSTESSTAKVTVCTFSIMILINLLS